jgi:RNase H-fold protein (predicted Holliday junction resolvase)
MTRIAGMDVSPNRIGIAFSDEACTFASESFLLTKKHNFVRDLAILYAEYTPSVTYIGLPVNFDGSTSEQTRFVKTFVHSVRHIIGKFIYKDERFTTKKAKELNPPSKKSIDEIVAINLLTEELNNIKLQ